MEINITIDENAVIDIDLTGFVGKDCSKVSEELAKALGKVVKSSKKCEFYKQDTKQKQKLNRF